MRSHSPNVECNIHFTIVCIAFEICYNYVCYNCNHQEVPVQPLPALAYLLTALALAAGLSLGWLLRPRWEHHRNVGAVAPPDEAPAALSEDKRRAVQDAEVELAHLEAQLAQLQQSIAATRRQIQESSEEHRRLLLDLDAQEASRQDARGTLYTVRQNLEAQKSRTDEMLADINASMEEYEVLSALSETYAARIRRLTQETQRQDSELQLLRQTLNARAAEIREAQQQVQQREAELRDLRRQCQQREAQIAEARQQLAERSEELRRLIDGQVLHTHIADERPIRRQGRVIDVTPPNRPRLTPGDEVGSELSFG